MQPDQPVRLEIRGLTKRFYDVAAIDSVSFDLVGGEIHGLLGENGAGKSTLCSVLAGLYRADEGEIRLDGTPVRFRSPLEAARHGIGMVYQHFRLVESFTVAENLTLGLPRGEQPRGRRQVEAAVEELAAEYGLAVDPRARIWQLSVGEQQRVEILKQLFRGARVLILDEPTAVLAPQEAEGLFAAVRHMADHGHAVVLVSHKLQEILGSTDRVTVLRQGRNAGAASTATLSPRDLSSMMFGDDAHDAVASRASAPIEPGEPVLEVDGLRVDGDRGVPAVHDVSLVVRRGEIVGVAGVAGNGQRELQETIAGLRPARSGTVTIAGTPCRRGPRQRAGAGLAYVPEDRMGTGLAPGLTLDHNMVLKSYRRAPHARFGLLSRRGIRSTTTRLTEAFDVRGARDGMRVSLMSGGNLQKAILARELTEAHEVLLAAAPTRGLDMAAAASVRDHLLKERAEGRGVLLFSEDLAEVVELSDIVLVMHQGRIVGRFTADELSIDEIGLLMTGAAA